MTTSTRSTRATSCGQSKPVAHPIPVSTSYLVFQVTHGRMFVACTAESSGSTQQSHCISNHCLPDDDSLANRRSSCRITWMAEVPLERVAEAMDHLVRVPIANWAIIKGLPLDKLYDSARVHAGAPLSLAAGKLLLESCQPGRPVLMRVS